MTESQNRLSQAIQETNYPKQLDFAATIMDVLAEFGQNTDPHVPILCQWKTPMHYDAHVFPDRPLRLPVQDFGAV